MFRLISIIGIVGAVAACMLHYVAIGRRRWKPDKRDVASVYRFSISERLIHALSILAFLTLAATGFWTVIALDRSLEGWLWIIHAAAGAIFAAAVVLMTLVWAMDCRFAGYDWTWIKRCGGYLGGNMYIPADRFNAGQKAYFWSIVLIGLTVLLSGLGRMAPVFGDTIQEVIYQVHRYGTLLFVMSVVVHLYLGTLANPGTVWSIILGRVSVEWAAHHHPLWWEENGGTSDICSRK